MIRSFLLLVVLFTTSLQAQVAFTGKLSTQEGAGIPFAAIVLEPGAYHTQTDARGRFELQVEKGEYSVRIAMLGYRSLDTTITLRKSEELEFEMKESVLDLPEFVIASQTMTGGLNSSFQIAGSAQYLSPKEIDRFSYTDVSRTLRAVPGVNIQEEDGFGLRPNIGLRGTGVERSSKITLMEDGILMAPAPYSAPSAYYFPTIGRMQAVEIMKGSSQVRFGPFTTGGALNLISTQIPTDLAGKIDISFGNFGRENLHAYLGNNHGQVAYLVESFQFGADGFKQLPDGGSTGFDKSDYLFKFRLNTKADAKVYQSISLKLGLSEEVSHETYLGLAQSDFETDPYQRYAASQKDLMTTNFRQLSAKHILVPAKDLHITTTVYRNDFGRNWYKLDKVLDDEGRTVGIAGILDSPVEYRSAMQILRGTSTSDSSRLMVKANNRDYYAQGIQSNLNKSFRTGEAQHKFEFSVRWHQDEMDRFQWVDAYSMENGVMKLREKCQAGTESNRIERAEALATYFQYELQYGRWTVVPGLRFENIEIARVDYGKNDPDRIGTSLSSRSNKIQAWVPGASVNYNLEEETILFAGVHKGFAPPGSKEGTRPEESINSELGLKSKGERLSVQAILFLNDYQNLLGTDLAAAGGAGSTDLFNGGAARSQGLEFQMTYLFSEAKESKVRFPLSVVYTYTDAYFRHNFDSDFEAWGSVQSGDKLPYMAEHQLSILGSLESKCLELNVTSRFVSAMRTLAGSGAIQEEASTDAQAIVDASAIFRVTPSLRLSVRATNLTDQVYVVSRRPAGLRPGMPRAVSAGLRFDF
jgi:Fe(3+) dicitrate transport protein